MEANQHHPRRSSLDRDNEMHLLSHQEPPALPHVAIMPLSLPLQSNSSTSTTAAATASSYPPSSVTAMGGGPTVLLHQRSELRRSFTATPPPHHHHNHHHHQRTLSSSSSSSSPLRKANNEHHRTLTKYALIQNDSMVYLDGPTLYTCGNCRTHLTSHDDIISKSFHGRHGKVLLVYIVVDNKSDSSSSSSSSSSSLTHIIYARYFSLLYHPSFLQKLLPLP